MQRSNVIVRVLVSALLAGGVALAVRNFVIEPDFMGQLCTGADAPLWCLARQGLILGFAFNAYGYLSVAAAVLALGLRRAWLAWFALGVGVLGCVLYRFDPAGAGVLLAALVLARLGAREAECGTSQQQA